MNKYLNSNIAEYRKFLSSKIFNSFKHFWIEQTDALWKIKLAIYITHEQQDESFNSSRIKNFSAFRNAEFY